MNVNKTGRLDKWLELSHCLTIAIEAIDATRERCADTRGGDRERNFVHSSQSRRDWIAIGLFHGAKAGF